MANHCRLDGGHQFAGFRPERGEAEDLVGVRGDQHLHEPARLGQGAGPQRGGHRQREQAVAQATAVGFGLVAADPGQLRIGVHAIRTSRPAVVRWPPCRLSCTTRKSSKATWVNCGPPAHSPDDQDVVVLRRRNLPSSAHNHQDHVMPAHQVRCDSGNAR